MTTMTGAVASTHTRFAALLLLALCTSIAVLGVGAFESRPVKKLSYRASGRASFTRPSSLSPVGRHRLVCLQWRHQNDNENKYQKTWGQPRRSLGWSTSSSSLSSSRDGSGDKKRNPTTNPKLSAWDSFKIAVYGSVDAVDDLASKIKGEEVPKSSKTLKSGPTAPIASSSVVKEGVSPAQKILQEYEVRTQTLDIGSSSITPAPQPISNNRKLKPFDALKETVYSTVDASSQLLSKKPDEPAKSTTPVLDRSVPPAVRTNLATDMRNPDLSSSNPIVRLKAQQKLREEEAKKRAIVRRKRNDEFKESIYSVVDAVERTIESVPKKVAETKKAVEDFSDWVRTVPNQVGKVAEDVQAIPSRVTNKVKKTKDDVETKILTTKESVETGIRTTKETVETSISTTKKVVENVQDLPNKVVRSVDAAKKKVSDTKASVDETVTNVKVLVGLEKPKPKPPKVKPPEPPTASNIALQVVGTVVKSGASFVWWVSRETFEFMWDRAQEIIDSRPKQLPTSSTSVAASKSSKINDVSVSSVASTETNKDTSGTVSSAVVASPSVSSEKSSEAGTEHTAKLEPVIRLTTASKGDTGKETDNIQKEVEDALLAAEESLKRAEELKVSIKKDDIQMEVEDALRIAEESLKRAEELNSSDNRDK